MTPEQVYAAWQNREPIEPVQLARALRAALDKAAENAVDAKRWRRIVDEALSIVELERAKQGSSL